jgi:anti-sigma B factor antagonist
VARPSPPNSNPVFSIESLRLDDGVMLVLRGELDLSTVSAVDGELARDEEAHRLIAIDLRELEFIDSTGLHMLIRADHRVREAGGRLVLVNGSPQVNRVFELTRMAEHLEVVEEPPAPAD